MIRTREVDKPAQITFTLDFHELVTGDLRPGRVVVLSDDPKRIVPEGEPYVFGDPAHPITAFVQYRDGGPVTSAVLESPGGIPDDPDEDPTGQGSMLKARLTVPDDADLVIVWFTYLSHSGATLHDSDFGKNFYFGFPRRDIDVLDATVTSNPGTPYSGFGLKVAASPRVEGMSVRYHTVGDPRPYGDEFALQKDGSADDEGRPIWAAYGRTVPYRAVVRFKIFYWIGGRRFKDDNAGHYYLAPQPEPEKVPPPPPGLAEAARAWK